MPPHPPPPPLDVAKPFFPPLFPSSPAAAAFPFSSYFSAARAVLRALLRLLVTVLSVLDGVYTTLQGRLDVLVPTVLFVTGFGWYLRSRRTKDLKRLQVRRRRLL